MHRSTVFRCFQAARSKAGGRPPRLPSRLRSAAWSAGCGITAVVRTKAKGRQRLSAAGGSWLSGRRASVRGVWWSGSPAGAPCGGPRPRAGERRRRWTRRRHRPHPVPHRPRAVQRSRPLRPLPGPRDRPGLTLVSSGDRPCHAPEPPRRPRLLWHASETRALVGPSSECLPPVEQKGGTLFLNLASASIATGRRGACLPRRVPGR